MKAIKSVEDLSRHTHAQYGQVLIVESGRRGDEGGTFEANRPKPDPCSAGCGSSCAKKRVGREEGNSVLLYLRNRRAASRYRVTAKSFSRVATGSYAQLCFSVGSYPFLQGCGAVGVYDSFALLPRSS